jgi:hypothetical protein
MKSREDRQNDLIKKFAKTGITLRFLIPGGVMILPIFVDPKNPWEKLDVKIDKVFFDWEPAFDYLENDNNYENILRQILNKL